MERTPCAAHVVADVFAELDGFGAALFGGGGGGVQVAGLHEASPDSDDGVGFPGLLHFARFPEEGEDPLLEGVSGWGLDRDMGGEGIAVSGGEGKDEGRDGSDYLLQGLHSSAVRLGG